jgi:hypothetical protein
MDMDEVRNLFGQMAAYVGCVSLVLLVAGYLLGYVG